MTSKLKTWLVALGILAVTGVLVLLRYRSNKLKALNYKLQMVMSNHKVEALVAKLGELSNKIDAGNNAYIPIREYYAGKLSNVLLEYKEYESSLNQITNILSDSNTAPPSSDTTTDILPS